LSYKNSADLSILKSFFINDQPFHPGFKGIMHIYTDLLITRYE